MFVGLKKKVLLDFYVHLLVVVAISCTLIQVTYAADACQKLAICALDKCIPSPAEFPTETEIITKLLGSANFGCVLGPTCYEQCNQCETCKYAQEQVKRLILHEDTEGRCPNLEDCAKTCVLDVAHAKDPFACVFRSRCINFCLDNQDCPQCYDIVKRVFTGYCYRNGYIERYGKKCRPFFDELAKEFVKDKHD
uniref:Uncharacterized protein n=1 Tax=Acrobeloides nanus TaxID=290746 RepID=A0A914DR21_9BILA